ncbi:MAG: adenine phosphoribosyltransferase [Firmicutes bacterium]|nr:adenine phosphoribosyltransferase [Bacillota bacterium]
MAGQVGTFVAHIGSQQLDLPVTLLSEDLAVALLITADLDLDVLSRAASELAAKLSETPIDIVVTAATMGIPLAIEVTKSLGLNKYLVLHKTPKTYLQDALCEEVKSITTNKIQTLRLDAARIKDVQNKSVAFIDDVISTGQSAAAALRLLRKAGANISVIGTLATENGSYKEILGHDAVLIKALGSLPIFKPTKAPEEQVKEWEPIYE